MFTKYLQSLKQFKSGHWTPELNKDLTDLSNSSTSLLVQNLYLKHKLATADSFSTQSERAISDSKSLAETKLWTPFQSIYANTLATAITIENSWQVHEQLLDVIVNSKLTKFERSPAVLAYVQKLAIDQSSLISTKNKQENRPSTASDFLSRKKTLQAYLSAQSIKTVSVVGNSPDILKQEHGSAIDSADCVIRFNNSSELGNHQKHTGKKFDIWVANPGYQFTDTHVIKPNHICLSSYYPYERTSKYWRNLYKYVDAEYLELPPGIWSDLTRQLQAPPSAGLQCLTALSKYNLTIKAYGFTLNRKNNSNSEQNHFTDSEKRSARHNWDVESALLQNLAGNKVQFFQ